MNIRHIKFETRPRDFNSFRSRKDLYEGMLEDGLKVKPEYDWERELLNPLVMYYGIFDDGDLLGFVKMCRLGEVLWEAHICLDFPIRNKIGLQACLGIKKMFFEQYPKAKVFGIIPSSLKHAIYFAYAVGFKHRMTLRDSFLKDGVLYNRNFLELGNG